MSDERPHDTPPPAGRPVGVVRGVLGRLLFEDDEEPAFDEALIRTYLANERTFLAWLRSAVVLLGVGVGAIAIGTGENVSEGLAFSLGGVSVVSALVMIVWAYLSFGRTMVGIERRRYRPPRRLVLTASALLIAAGLVALALLLVELAG